MYRILATLLRPFLAMVARRDWQGAQYLDRPGGYIVVANHVSDIDPLTTAHLLYVQGRAPKIMAKDSLFRVPVLGWFLRGTHMIPVYRGTANAADSLVAATEALEAGEVVLIFPEGTLTKDPALWPMTAKSGAARLALTSGVPVIPVAQWGTHTILPRGTKVPRIHRRHDVHVHVGPPVDLADLQGKPITTAVLTEATGRIMDDIVGGVEAIRGEQAPAQRYDPRAATRGASSPTVKPPASSPSPDREDNT